MRGAKSGLVGLALAAGACLPSEALVSPAEGPGLVLLFDVEEGAPRGYAIAGDAPPISARLGVPSGHRLLLEYTSPLEVMALAPGQVPFAAAEQPRRRLPPPARAFRWLEEGATWRELDAVAAREDELYKRFYRPDPDERACAEEGGCYLVDDELGPCTTPCPEAPEPEPPALPDPPELGCPTDWAPLSVDVRPTVTVPYCDPLPTLPACGAHGRYRAGVGCVPLAPSCEADFPRAPDPNRTTVYLRAGEVGGDGSLARPFGDLAQAFTAAGTGGVILIGRSAAPVAIGAASASLFGAVTLIGACPEEARLEGTLLVYGIDVELDALSFEGELVLFDHASATVRHSTLIATGGWAVWTATSAFSAEESRITGGREGGVGGFNSTMRLSQVTLDGEAGVAVFTTRGRLELGDSFVASELARPLAGVFASEADVLIERTRFQGLTGPAIALRSANATVSEVVIRGGLRRSESEDSAIALALAGEDRRRVKFVGSRIAIFGQSVVSSDEKASYRFAHALRIQFQPRVRLSDLLIVGTEREEHAGGLLIQASNIELERAAFTGLRGVGISFVESDPARLDAQDLIISAIEAANGSLGNPIVAYPDIDVSLSRVWLGPGGGTALTIEKSETSLEQGSGSFEVLDLTVEGMEYGGVRVAGGVGVNADRVRMIDNASAGVRTYTGSSRFTNIQVEGTRAARLVNDACFAACLGSGVYASVGGELTVEQFVLADNNKVGASVVGAGARLRLAQGRIVESAGSNSGPALLYDNGTITNCPLRDLLYEVSFEGVREIFDPMSRCQTSR